MRPSDLYLETSRVRLRYRDEGRGQAVVLLHGWTLDLEQWDSQAAALQREFRVVRLDRRGFGLSSGVPSIDADVADLSALCAHLALDRVALLGMSQGARAALKFAGAHPQMTSCVILDGAPLVAIRAESAAANDVPYQHFRALAQAQGLAAFRREWSEHGLVRLRTDDPAARELLLRMIERYPGTDLLDDAPAAAQNTDTFGSMDLPLLIMNGEFDLDSRRRFAAEFASHFPRAERIEVPNAGHLSNLDNPRAYNEAVRRFLQKYAYSSINQ